jgi:serine/threonine protein kinase
MTVWRPGHIFGGYRLLESIASGGMGDLWLASKEGLAGTETFVALKLLKPKLAEDEHFVALFMAEARIATRLDHPNIVHTFDSGQDGNVLWLVMQYVQGADLSAIRHASQGVPSHLALFIACGLLKALQYAHGLKGPDGASLHLVHRDVKPANVLVAFDGYVKLTDFGVAKAYAESTIEGAATGTGRLKGTAGYVAPELINGAPASPASDVFATGVVLFETLTGRHLFGGKSPNDRWRNTVEGGIPRLQGVPPAVEDYVRTLLAPRPEDRFETAAAALQAGRSLPGVRDVTEEDLRDYLATLPLTKSALTSLHHPGSVPEPINDVPAVAPKTGSAPTGRRPSVWLGVAPGTTEVGKTGDGLAPAGPVSAVASDHGASETGRTGDTAGSAAGEVSTSRVEARPRSRRWLVASICVGALVVAGAAALLVGNGNSRHGAQAPREAQEVRLPTVQAPPAPPPTATEPAVAASMDATVPASPDAGVTTGADTALAPGPPKPRSHGARPPAPKPRAPSSANDDFEDLRAKDPPK